MTEGYFQDHIYEAATAVFVAVIMTALAIVSPCGSDPPKN